MTDRRIRATGLPLRAGLGLGLALLGLAVVRAESPRAIPWRADLDQARAEAVARDLPLWIQFTGPWCHHCRRMEGEAFLHPDVLAAAEASFIPIKLRSDVHEDLALGFGLSALPSTVILKPDGEVIAKQEGYADVDGFRAFLGQALRRAGRSIRFAGRTTPAPSPGPEATDARGEGVALAGFCPVSLVEGRRLAPGQPDLAVRHDGREYRFADTPARDAFRKEPERFVPANAGRCPVSQVDRGEAVAGDPHWGVVYREHLYLCADESARARFLKSPEAYCGAGVADHGFCPHCRGQSGVLVRGSHRYTATHSGRRYLFPDARHLEAFRAEPEKYLR